MNRKLGMIILTAVLCAGMTAHSFAAVKTGSGSGIMNAEHKASAGTVSGKSFGKVPSYATVLVVVEANGEESNATGVLSVYRRKSASDPWTAELENIPACMGRGGMGKIKEGDRKTPCGMFLMNTPFGIGEKEASFPDNYLTLNDNYYWGGNSGRNTYNRLFDKRNASSEDLKGSEHLAEIYPEYNYAIDTGYNPECTGGKGSAIFLHCKGPNVYTSGCIAIDEDAMKKVLRLYEDKKTVIIIDIKGSFDKYE